MTSPLRSAVLYLGPVALVAGCYLLAAPNGWSRTDRPRADLPVTAVVSREERDARMNEACVAAAHRLRSRPGHDLQTLVRPPFVLAGRQTVDELEHLHRELIRPLERTLRTAYFDAPPPQPICVLLMDRDADLADWIGSRSLPKGGEYAGFYLRDERMIVVNAKTGEGTIAHELTHALAHADCPALPEWLDEGLAALHEESEFSDDGVELIGLDNWRRPLLAQAYARDQFPALTQLLREEFARSDRPALEYAHARYFCLFLQSRQLLTHFYRKCRTAIAADPTGERALCELFDTDDAAEVDREFRRWFADRP